MKGNRSFAAAVASEEQALRRSIASEPPYGTYSSLTRVVEAPEKPLLYIVGAIVCVEIDYP